MVELLQWALWLCYLQDFLYFPRLIVLSCQMRREEAVSVVVLAQHARENEVELNEHLKEITANKHSIKELSDIQSFL